MRSRLLIVASISSLAIGIPAAFAAHRSMEAELGAALSGKSEPMHGPSKGHGVVNLTVNSDNGKVCWTFEGIAGIDKPTAAHIHKAPVGKEGAVVVPLGGAFKTKGCVTASKKTVAAIEAKPRAYYVNVHTKKYPAGAIRGQLHTGMAHM